MTVVTNASEKTILDEINAANASNQFVIVGLEGTGSRLTSYAISQSDLVVIPMKEQQQDALAAIDVTRELMPQLTARLHDPVGPDRGDRATPRRIDIDTRARCATRRASEYRERGINVNKPYAASLAAIMACASTQTSAARYLIVDIAAIGTGTGMTGSRTGARPTTYYSFTTFYASLSYNLEGIFAPRIVDDELRLVGTITAPNVSGQSTASGFGFQVFLPTQHFVNYGITGNACFANDAPSVVPVGPKTVTPGCGAITANYSDGFAIAGYSFTGVVEGIDFRIVDADALPAITFAIPEPATWALMLAGFGLTGHALRRRRPRVAFTA